MQTDCNPDHLAFESFDGRRIVAAFDGGAITSNAGALLLRHTDKAIDLFDRVAACFSDQRDRSQVVHGLPATSVNVADNSRPTIFHVDTLHCHFLLTLAPQAVQCFQLFCKKPHELDRMFQVRVSPGRRLCWQPGLLQAFHRGFMNPKHLQGKKAFEFVLRFDLLQQTECTSDAPRFFFFTKVG